jgi:undecaprenyl-diphosphatase
MTPIARSLAPLRRLLPSDMARLGALAAIGVAAGSLLGFVSLTDEVLQGETDAFDRAVLLAFRHPADPADPLGPRWLESAVRDVTSLGGTAVLSLIVAAAALYLVLDGRRASALLVLVSAIGGWALGNGMKLLIDRARPDVVPHLMTEATLSYPSGHAMMSAVIYLTLGALLARAQPRRRIKAYLFAVAAVVALLVGLSRVYLGVHWPTDVLAGWTVGAAWATACLLAASWLERRRR